MLSFERVKRQVEITGSQRKAVAFSVRPVSWEHGEEGIPVRGGKTLPFVLIREWTAPAGHYEERWYLVDPETREVLYESPARETLIWGLQSLTQVTDWVREPIQLQPGTYRLVFALQGIFGGEFDVEAVEVPAGEGA